MEKDSPFFIHRQKVYCNPNVHICHCFCLCTTAKISVSIKELPLKEAISQIAEKALMNVAYSKEFVDTSRKVSLEVKRHRCKQSTNSFAKRD